MNWLAVDWLCLPALLDSQPLCLTAACTLVGSCPFVGMWAKGVKAWCAALLAAALPLYLPGCTRAASSGWPKEAAGSPVLHVLTPPLPPAVLSRRSARPCCSAPRCPSG